MYQWLQYGGGAGILTKGFVVSGMRSSRSDERAPKQEDTEVVYAESTQQRAASAPKPLIQLDARILDQLRPLDNPELD
jgi:hypothetical protein